MSLAFLILVVFIAGFIDSIAGGGGLLTVPAYLLVGIPPVTTLGTNKCVSSIGTAVAAAHFIHGRLVLWRVVIIGVLFTLIGANIGAHHVITIDPSTVRTIILVLLPIAALLTLAPKPHSHAEVKMDWHSKRLWIVVPLIALALGWYDGVFGPGTGSLLTLAFFGLGGFSLLHAAATARCLNLISNIGAAVMFLIHGHVDLHLIPPLAIAGIAGNFLGSHLALKRGDGVVRLMLAFTSLLLFVSLLWQGIR